MSEPHEIRVIKPEELTLQDFLNSVCFWQFEAWGKSHGVIGTPSGDLVCVCDENRTINFPTMRRAKVAHPDTWYFAALRPWDLSVILHAKDGESISQEAVADHIERRSFRFSVQDGGSWLIDVGFHAAHGWVLWKVEFVPGCRVPVRYQVKDEVISVKDVTLTGREITGPCKHLANRPCRQCGKPVGGFKSDTCKECWLMYFSVQGAEPGSTVRFEGMGPEGSGPIEVQR